MTALKRNKIFTAALLITVTILDFLIGSSHCQILKVKQLDDEGKKVVLASKGLEHYPQQPIDIIWNISYPVEIEVSLFDIDFQGGEYVIIGEYPLPSDYRLLDGAPAEDAVTLLPVESSLLLTSNVVPEITPNEAETQDDQEVTKEKKTTLTVKVNSEYGGFIYFHGIAKKSTIKTEDSDSEVTYLIGTDSDSNGKINDIDLDVDSKTRAGKKPAPPAPPPVFNYDGFRMTVTFFDLDPFPITTTTTEKLTTPYPGVDIYLYKHILGRTPSQFLETLPEFKEAVAEMANKYCTYKNLDLQREIVSNNVTDDIRLDEDTILFCDRRTSYYENCVQIQLAIPMRSSDGEYVLITPYLEEMWKMYAEEALAGIPVDEGLEPLRPYEPPVEASLISTWIWVAAILGVILLLLAILVTSLITTIFDRRAPRGDAEMKIPFDTEEDQPSTSSYSRKNNPLMKVIDAVKRGKEAEEYHGMREIERDIAVKSKNSLNRVPVFDNPRYIHDDNSDEYIANRFGGPGRRQNNLQVPAPYEPRQYDRGPSNNRSNNQMHHTFQAEVHSNEGYSDSDGEENLYHRRHGH